MAGRTQQIILDNDEVMLIETVLLSVGSKKTGDNANAVLMMLTVNQITKRMGPDRFMALIRKFKADPLPKDEQFDMEKMLTEYLASAMRDL